MIRLWAWLKQWAFDMARSGNLACPKCACTIPFGKSSWYDAMLKAHVCRRCAPNPW